jgi:hypothetical protein
MSTRVELLLSVDMRENCPLAVKPRSAGGADGDAGGSADLSVGVSQVAAPDSGGGLIPASIDTMIMVVHSEGTGHTDLEEYVRPPLTPFAIHGAIGSGEPLAIMLRRGNAGSNTAAGPYRGRPAGAGRTAAATAHTVLIRTDCGEGTREFLA